MPENRRPVVRPVLADAVAILAFAAAGRRSHAEGMTIAGLLQTAGPFLAGAAVGWLICRGWRAPAAISPTGLTVWLSTVVVGMGLRAGLGLGTAWSFVLVATGVTGALLLGWRALVTVARSRR